MCGKYIIIRKQIIIMIVTQNLVCSFILSPPGERSGKFSQNGKCGQNGKFGQLRMVSLVSSEW